MEEKKETTLEEALRSMFTKEELEEMERKFEELKKKHEEGKANDKSE